MYIKKHTILSKHFQYFSTEYLVQSIDLDLFCVILLFTLRQQNTNKYNTFIHTAPRPLPHGTTRLDCCTSLVITVNNLAVVASILELMYAGIRLDITIEDSQDSSAATLTHPSNCAYDNFTCTAPSTRDSRSIIKSSVLCAICNAIVLHVVKDYLKQLWGFVYYFSFEQRVSVDGAAAYQETAALSSVHKTLKWNDVLFFSNVMVSCVCLKFCARCLLSE